MRFTKPAWVQHKEGSKSEDGNVKRQSIFSVHVHPDGSRIATGGLDAKIRIWSTKPILNPASEESGKPPKSLCTLTMHTGPVLTVRWAHSGRWLASGSDDEIVMIWDLDPHARGKVWGSDEVNVEGWKPLKRLPGHESDVTDVAWSPGDRYLASVALDSQVLIWCGFTLERLRKLDQHQGFVKGVCWDPVGEFLATQSDDRSVKVWRTTDWSLEAEITKPFEDSPGSTFFRRLSWSPDGAHITASNATNNKGFVFIAAVITRGTWTSDISLVGHENTVEVAAYNPHIFLRNPSAPVATANICSVVALGADDHSVSVWQTKSARPLIVAKEVFDRQILDLSWSWDGLTLYAASSDGTIGVFAFEPEELEGIAPHSVQEHYLSKFGFTPPPLPESFSHMSASNTQPLSPRSHSQSQMASQTSGFGGATVNGGASGGGEKVNILTAKRGPKKRANLSTPSNIPSAATTAGPSQSHQQRGTSMMMMNNITQAQPPESSTSTSTTFLNFPPPEEQPFVDADMDMAPIDAMYPSPPNNSKGKRKASEMEGIEDNTRPYPGRTLGGDRLRDDTPGRAITIRHAVPSTVGSRSKVILPALPLMTKVTGKLDDTEDILEAINSEDRNVVTELIYVSGNQTLWMDYLPSPALACHGTRIYCAAAMLDGTVNVYSRTGRRLMPTLALGSPAAHIDGTGNCVSIITEAGELYSWNVPKQSAFFHPISIIPVIASGPNIRVTAVTVQASGVPILSCTNGVMYSYDGKLASWVKLSDKWWAEGSDVWPGRTRASATSSRTIVAWLEGNIDTDPQAAAETPRPEWWNTAMTLGHLETRLHASRLLGSSVEYRSNLLLYAKRIADEGFRAKAEELIKELFGPVYWRPGDARTDDWSPTILNIPKRDLLKEVLSQFTRSKTLTKLALDWQDLLKRVAVDEL